jgi:hypothetical protein
MGSRLTSRTLHYRSPLTWFLWSALALSFFTGCNGCVQEDPLAKKKAQEELEKKKKEEKPKEDYTFGEIRAQPNEFTKDRAKINYVKRGHWVTTNQLVRANNADVQTDIESVVTNMTSPYDVEHTRYSLAYSRPAAFPKGQAKPIETLFFIPRVSVKTQSVNLRNDLVNVRGSSQPIPQSTSVLPLEEWQYLFLVLSSRPSAFNILEKTQSFAPLVSFNDSAPSIRYYQLLRPSVEKNVPLPTNALTWSSIAVILWDDIDPALFTPEQQTAFLDWLHWGGVVIVNGPNSISRLGGSFLEPYLPAESVADCNLDVPDFRELNTYWSLRTSKHPQAARDLTPAKPLAGLKLACRPHGQFVPHTGGLVAEGRVGQGRVVLTAFPLNSMIVQNWKNFDGFLNGALLRRPARRFAGSDEANQRCTWSHPDLAAYLRDARLISNMRYFARDVAFEKDFKLHPYLNDVVVPSDPAFPDAVERITSSALMPGSGQDERFNGWMAVPKAGVASWNNFSGATNAARAHVIDAAGIRIPTAEFVFKVLGAYLIILVPLNWALFRLIGKVEWAWFAAPVIAIGGAFMVTRLAHLDIGFVRSRTEIDVIEFQPGYERAHVSRYINLYTALSTGYDLVFEDPTALAQPLPEDATEFKPFSAKSRVELHRDSNLSLSGFKVESNSQGMVRVEQHLNLGGNLMLQTDDDAAWKLRNGSQIELRNVIVLRRTSEGYQHALLEQLPYGVEQPLKFSDAEETIDVAHITRGSTMLQPTENEAVPELRLTRFLHLALDQLKLQIGDVRLIAWSDGAVPGIEYRPDSAQVNAVTFVIAHLRRAPLTPPERDANVLADIMPNEASITITPEDLEKETPPTEDKKTSDASKSDSIDE